MAQTNRGLSKIADAMSGESEYDCPSCKQTLTLESFGEYECPYCHHKFPYGIDELRIGGPLWKDQSLRNRKIASIISKGAGLIGAAIVLTAIAFPGPIQVIGGIIFIVYLVIVPRVLEANGIIGSDWRSGAGGDNSGGGGGGG
ncbi:MAG: hypothetical protein ACPHZ4_05395 [Candidatus Poseidoniaceae archaeon]